MAPDLWRVEREAHPIAQAIAAHCGRTGDRIALLHTRVGLAPADVPSRPFDLPEPDARFAAVYYPWLTVTDSDGSRRLVPATGHVSGLCGRVDAEQGVHTAPVSALVGVLEHERELTYEERELLAGRGVNCLRPRAFPERSIWVSDARTLSLEPDWTQLGVRRLVSHARASLERGTRWTTTEPDPDRARALIRRSATTFLTDLWRQGALHGWTADEAFRVVCDDRNNTPEGMARGRVNLDVGLAAVRPAEFIDFRVQQPIGHTPA
ncbi:phage tail sheath family protein [Streptomyces tuirus]|uniref:Phage tail sheath family protein n=1 Tax=Streptomyces tuirus TaxID=68278 RepID=A0A941J0D5_9ACTN|nr:phage tail sheath family protein [Streptomyces tuirus]